jgi:hypothetical protein
MIMKMRTLARVPIADAKPITAMLAVRSLGYQVQLSFARQLNRLESLQEPALLASPVWTAR